MVKCGIQCEGLKPNGTQCRKMTCRGNLCWMHLAKRNQLRIKKAPGMGLGLFTARSRYPGGDLDGIKYSEYLTGKHLDAKYPDEDKPAQYVLCNDPGTKCIDGIKVTSSFARFINHSETPNVSFGAFSKGPPRTLK